jgi:hypothetical protein
LIEKPRGFSKRTKGRHGVSHNASGTKILSENL